MSVPRLWYHRPEWIVAAIAVLGVAAGIVGAFNQGAAQTAQIGAQTNQNTKDIAELKGTVNAMPERLGRIEQKVDDLTSFEKRRHDKAGD